MMSIDANSRARLSPVKLRYYRNRFSDGLKISVEDGSLILLRWQIFREETKLHPEDRSDLLPLGKAIEARWSKIENEYGKGSLLVDQHETIQWSFPHDGCMLGPTNPKLLQNSRLLRKFKGEEWWAREHQLETLAEVVQFDNALPVSSQIRRPSEKSMA